VTASGTLDQASAIVSGALPVRVHSARAAAWVARSALEEVLQALVLARGCDPGGASARTLLGCIEVLYQDVDPTVPGRAQYAWDALSRASHHHAYELAPTVGEVEGLIETVRGLAELVATD